MAEPETDRQLVEQVLRGRTEAFNLLVWRWQRPLYNFLRRLTGDPDHALDLCQEAFLRAYTRLRDLREQDKFASWLFRIAANLYHSDRRRRFPGEEVGSEDSALLGAANLSGPGAARETQLSLRALIAGLPAEQREVLLLKVYHGFRFQEIASILDCPVSTIKSRLYKAFQQLRAGLKS